MEHLAAVCRKWREAVAPGPGLQETAQTVARLWLSVQPKYNAGMPWTHRAFWIGPLMIGGFLAMLVAFVWSTRLRRIYNARLAETRRERLFLASVGFFTAVLVVRGITIAIHLNFGPLHDVAMGGRHIHHLVWGILLLLISGYGWLLQVGTGMEGSLRWLGRLMSMIYGVASALTLDEFALSLNCETCIGSVRGAKASRHWLCSEGFWR